MAMLKEFNKVKCRIYRRSSGRGIKISTKEFTTPRSRASIWVENQQAQYQGGRYHQEADVTSVPNSLSSASFPRQPVPRVLFLYMYSIVSICLLLYIGAGLADQLEASRTSGWLPP